MRRSIKVTYNFVSFGMFCNLEIWSAKNVALSYPRVTHLDLLILVITVPISTLEARIFKYYFISFCTFRILQVPRFEKFHHISALYTKWKTKTLKFLASIHRPITVVPFYCLCILSVWILKNPTLPWPLHKAIIPISFVGFVKVCTFMYLLFFSHP